MVADHPGPTRWIHIGLCGRGPTASLSPPPSIAVAPNLQTTLEWMFDAALAHFGVLGLTELTNLMGCYSMLAFNVNAFGVELPTDSPEKPLPI